MYSSRLVHVHQTVHNTYLRFTSVNRDRKLRNVNFTSTCCVVFNKKSLTLTVSRFIGRLQNFSASSLLCVGLENCILPSDESMLWDCSFNGSRSKDGGYWLSTVFSSYIINFLIII